ncbi:hypothetical protein [Nitrosopumilus adriaticus]|uniref:Uncharacterized protein n=1 Tax=Nitrosopumilus adriaticus TaxID=1580092 RepID=A0A0D5C398_9ARCH|nr:hypothetical protein [Nitrosopumilus adriaticus]AJW70795.1 conserved exported protein of unknown function [Nitrosopumilus adriaticus]
MKLTGLFVLFLVAILFSSPLVSQSFADVIPPKQQMKLDYTAEQIICAEGLVKITKASSGNVSCVKPESAEKLSQMGWAKKLTDQNLEEIKTKKVTKGQAAGTINKLFTVKQLSPSKTSATSTSISGYAFIFDACANDKVIRTPEIYVTSDSETKQVKLGSMINANSCYTSSVLIKAANPESITAKLLNKGGISEKISSLETKVADLKSQIKTLKQTLPKTEENPNPETINNIISLKKELNDVQDQLRRYLVALYVPPNVKVSKIDFPKSITGQPLTGMTTNLISVSESVVVPVSSNPDLKRFNVVFEACSGMEPIRVPVITVDSDSDSVDVKLIDRIIPESCQVGIGKINAVDSDTIIVSISENSSISTQISSLEKHVDELQLQLGEKRKSLGVLVSKQLDSTGEEAAAQLALDISDLRKELLETRTKLYGVMLGL